MQSFKHSRKFVYISVFIFSLVRENSETNEDELLYTGTALLHWRRNSSFSFVLEFSLIKLTKMMKLSHVGVAKTFKRNGDYSNTL